jgi:hypothetical protein
MCKGRIRTPFISFHPTCIREGFLGGLIELGSPRVASSISSPWDGCIASGGGGISICTSTFSSSFAPDVEGFGLLVLRREPSPGMRRESVGILEWSTHAFRRPRRQVQLSFGGVGLRADIAVFRRVW